MRSRLLQVYYAAFGSGLQAQLHHFLGWVLRSFGPWDAWKALMSS
jgi:hypothetical protein